MNQKNPTETPLAGLSRRSFVQAAAAAGAAATVLPISARAQAVGNSTIKVALVGCGGRGSGAANEALNNDGVKLVAMADVFRDRLDGSYNSIAQSRSDKMDVPEERKFIGFDAYKDAIKEADLVILATPPGFRPAMFEEAVKQGKHVFMEKPVAVDAPGIRRVLAAAKEADEKGLKVVCGLQRHYQNAYTESYKQVHEEGAIGDIISGQVYWNGGGVWVRPRSEGETEMQYQMKNWYYFNWLCGDHITEQHVHNIDVFNWFKGGHPVSAQGMGGREVRDGSPDFGEIYDHHFVEFKYADGTILNSQCRHIQGCWTSVSETIVGTKGVLELGNGRIKGHDGNEIWRHQGRGDPNPYQVEHDVLQKHIREDIPINNAFYTAESTFASILGRYCTYSGKELKWDEALASGADLMPDNLAWDADPKVMPMENGLYPVAVPGQFDYTKA
ncbi:Gfo/Idh/MocA family oxidoreductase [soil metagenome]